MAKKLCEAEAGGRPAQAAHPQMGSNGASTTRPAAESGAAGKQAGVEEAAQSPAPALADLYRERQQESQCGMHALNNLLGAQTFDVESMESAAAIYLAGKEADGGLEDGEDLRRHLSASGWYSIEVMGFALENLGSIFPTDTRRFKMSLASLDVLAALSSEDPPCIGALVNHNGGHWSAIRKFPGSLVTA